jgi:hypothetical protein
LREKLAPGNVNKTRQLHEDLAEPPPPSRAPAAKPAPLEPEVEIDSGWQEAEAFPRRRYQDNLRAWVLDQQDRIKEFFGPEPLRRNRHKQAAAAIGFGLGFLLLAFALSSVFFPKPKLKLAKPPAPVAGEPASAAPQPSAPAGPTLSAAAPSTPQDVKPDTITPPQPAPAQPSPEETVPLATPVETAPKKPAAAPKPERPVAAAKPEKKAPKPVSPPAAGKAPKTETFPKLVATLDKETPARRKADAFTQQGRQAIVKKVKKGDKTVYQVWVTAAAASPPKPAAPASKPKTTAKSNNPASR